ncbi:hypothetical protein [Mannheimia indoligenes]|uniref:Uncharacterized protein n=1 Tax=Mannheimia indoligenes TaxID=3103145 RepID=A0ABU7ZGY2_9PAST
MGFDFKYRFDYLLPPFFKMYEKICVEKEQSQNLSEEEQKALIEKAKLAAK